LDKIERKAVGAVVTIVCDGDTSVMAIMSGRWLREKKAMAGHNSSLNPVAEVVMMLILQWCTEYW
jgi:hypothetical protein